MRRWPTSTTSSLRIAAPLVFSSTMTLSSWSLSFAFRSQFEFSQCLRPNRIEVVLDLSNSIGMETVVVSRAPLLVAHEPRVRQHAKMLGNGRPRYRQSVREFAD